jgi:group I intron endonuclease
VVVMVYAIVNQVNGKSYVGQTSRFPLSKRWCPSLKNSANPHLQAAINRYGPQSFKRYVLACASCQQEADLLEKFFILTRQTTDRRFGYNLQTGGRQGPGRHIEDVRQRISEGSKRMWARMSPKERWEFQLATKLRWLSYGEDERQKISQNITKALTGKPRTDTVWNKGISVGKGKPSPRKGRRFGPQQNPCKSWGPKSEEHRQHISEALKMHFAQKRQLPPKKPCVGVRGQGRPETPTNREETRATVALREVEQARHQLREIKKRLDALTSELEGGCSW